jgi:hypothetical protein
MTEIPQALAADALCLAGQLAQLGYPSELDAVTSRLAGLLRTATQQILVAAPPGDPRIDGYIGLERGRRATQARLMRTTRRPPGQSRCRPFPSGPCGTIPLIVTGRRTVPRRVAAP